MVGDSEENWHRGMKQRKEGEEKRGRKVKQINRQMGRGGEREQMKRAHPHFHLYVSCL